MKYPTTSKSLLERVQNGDEVSWNEFFLRYEPLIRCAGAGFHFNDAECDDLVQAVMLKFFQNAAKTFVYREGQVKFRTYFALIIRNTAIDLIRSNARQKNLTVETWQEETDPFGTLFLDEWRKAVFEEAKDELRSRVDPETYLAFELYALQNRSAGQVSETLGMTRKQLYAAKNRCLTILREIVERHNRADGDLHLEI